MGACQTWGQGFGFAGMTLCGLCRCSCLETKIDEVPKDMPAEAIVSELMGLLQNVLTECEHCELSTMEEKAVEFGRRAAELALGEMLASPDDEGVVVRCSCGASAYVKDRGNRTQVTLAGTHCIRRSRYYCGSCGSWIYPRDVELGIGSGNYSTDSRGDLGSDLCARLRVVTVVSGPALRLRVRPGPQFRADGDQHRRFRIQHSVRR